jgi:hypothetical protein
LIITHNRECKFFLIRDDCFADRLVSENICSEVWAMRDGHLEAS